MIDLKCGAGLIILAGVLIFLWGCSSDNFEDIHPGIYDTNAPCDTAGMTYDTDMVPLFLTHCGSDRNNCHKSPNTQDVNLDNYLDAKDLAVNGDMMGSILHQAGFKPMPNGGETLDKCSIDKIQNWIDRGCPQ